MSSIRVLRNAHHILGLPTGVDLVQIRQRANHLLNLARIEETESYPTDIPGVVGFRSEENIRKALEQLSNVKSRFLETFFWFEVTTVQDQDALKKLSKTECKQAIAFWHNVSVDSPNWLAKKNEALAGYVACFQTGAIEYFETSLNIWREIVVSDAFWSFYRDHYALTDDLGTDPALFTEIRSNLMEYLSWLALDLFRRHKNPEIVRIFFKATDLIGVGLEQHVLNPVIGRVRESLESFRKQLSSQSAEPLRLRTAKVGVLEAVRELSGYGADEYSPIKVLREECAALFRSMSIKANNDWDDIALAKEFIEAAAQFAVLESSRVQMKADSEQLVKNEAWTVFFKNLNARSVKGNTVHNWQVFLELESTLTKSIKQDKGFVDLKRRLLIDFAVSEFSAAKSAAYEKRYPEAADGMRKAHEVILKNLYLFTFNDATLVEIIDDLKARVGKISSRRDLGRVEGYLSEMLDIAKKTKWSGGDDTEAAFIMVTQSAIWLAIIPLLIELNKKKFFGIF